MITIDGSNLKRGNAAMASILLLYYHLLEDGGFTHEQTIYLNDQDFDGFYFLEVKVCQYQAEINQQLLREGAIIYLLCDLNDVVSNYPHDFLSQPYTKKIMKHYTAGKMRAIRETEELFSLFKLSDTDFNYVKYQNILRQIYTRYVVARFQNMIKYS